MATTLIGAQKIAAKKLGMSLDDYLARINAGQKRCYVCKSWKLLVEFDVDNSRGNKRAGACIECKRTAFRKTRIGGPPSEKVQQQAGSALNYAIRRGKLPKVSTLICTDCGSPACHYHHHLGYEKEHWLDVIPLCRGCHRRRHYE